MKKSLAPPPTDSEMWNRLGHLERALSLNEHAPHDAPPIDSFDEQLDRLDDGIVRETAQSVEAFYAALVEEAPEPIRWANHAAMSADEVENALSSSDEGEGELTSSDEAEEESALTSSVDRAVKSVDDVFDAFVRLGQELDGMQRWCEDLLQPLGEPAYGATPASELVPF